MPPSTWWHSSRKLFTIQYLGLHNRNTAGKRFRSIYYWPQEKIYIFKAITKLPESLPLPLAASHPPRSTRERGGPPVLGRSDLNLPVSIRLSGRARKGGTRASYARQAKTRHHKTRQGKAREGEARQGKTRQGKTRQDKARQDYTRQGKTRQGRARQDQARQNKARQGKTRPGKTK